MCGYEKNLAPSWRFVLVVFLLSNYLLAYRVLAAEPAQPIRIGVLNTSWGPTPGTVGLRDGLLELGYRENEDFVLGVRFTQGDVAALPAVARELVQYGVDLIFAVTGSPAQAAQLATTQIPIVFTSVSNPVELGLIESFARPGGNMTGVIDLEAELGPKRLEVFKALIPGLKRVLIPYAATDASSVAAVRGYREAARHLGLVLVEQAVRTEAEAQAALVQIQTDEVDGILGPRQPSLNLMGFVLEAASRLALPTLFGSTFPGLEHDGLASYGPDIYESGRQAARLVDKILKGTNPAEIPVEVNSKIMFTINLKVAKTLGLTIAPEMLYRADRIIR